MDNPFLLSKNLPHIASDLSSDLSSELSSDEVKKGTKMNTVITNKNRNIASDLSSKLASDLSTYNKKNKKKEEIYSAIASQYALSFLSRERERQSEGRLTKPSECFTSEYMYRKRYSERSLQFRKKRHIKECLPSEISSTSKNEDFRELIGYKTSKSNRKFLDAEDETAQKAFAKQ